MVVGCCPLIARAIGVLTSNSRGPWLRRWRRVWCHGGVPLLGAMVGAIASVIGLVCENCTVIDYLRISLLSSKTKMILTLADVSI